MRERDLNLILKKVVAEARPPYEPVHFTYMH